MILHLLRHGASQAPAGVACGWTDWPLLSSAQRAAFDAAQAWSLPPPTRLIASDLARAVSTATPFAARFGVSVQTDRRLRETSLGAWEGRSWAELEHSEAQRVARWYRDWRTEGPPGGESFADVVRRVGDVLAEFVATPRTLIIAHAGSIRAALVASGALSVDAAMALHLPPLAGVTLDLRSDGRPACAPLWAHAVDRITRSAGARPATADSALDDRATPTNSAAVKPR